MVLLPNGASAERGLVLWNGVMHGCSVKTAYNRLLWEWLMRKRTVSGNLYPVLKYLKRRRHKFSKAKFLAATKILILVRCKQALSTIIVHV